jgi:hypothetical protein
MAEAADLNAGRGSGSVLACVSAGGINLRLEAAEFWRSAALSTGLSDFIDILRRKPHLPPVLDELAVMPVEARLSSMGEGIRLLLLVEAILANRSAEAVGNGKNSDPARVVRSGGVGVAVSSSM